VLPNVQTAPTTTGSDGNVEFENLPVRAERIFAVAPGYWIAGALIPPGSLDEPLDVTIVLASTVRLHVEILDATTGKPLRHANLLVTHGGGDYWVWGGVLPPPDAPPRDHHDVEVRPGPVTVRAASPGFASAEVRVDVVAGEDAAPVTLRLVPHASV
jgi:hypothetical protein